MSEFFVFFLLNFFFNIGNVEGNDDNIGKENFDLPLFNLSTIAVATENFSPENVLGHGGFGDVYKVKQNNTMFNENKSRNHRKRNFFLQGCLFRVHSKMDKK